MNEIICNAPNRQQEGMLRIPLSDFESIYGEYPPDAVLLFKMLSGRSEFDSVELFEDEIIAQINPKYLPAENEQALETVSDPVISM